MADKENVNNLRLSMSKQPLELACPHCNRWVATWPSEKEVNGNKIQLGGVCEGCKRGYEMHLEIVALLSLQEK